MRKSLKKRPGDRPNFEKKNDVKQFFYWHELPRSREACNKPQTLPLNAYIWLFVLCIYTGPPSEKYIFIVEDFNL